MRTPFEGGRRSLYTVLALATALAGALAVVAGLLSQEAAPAAPAAIGPTPSRHATAKPEPRRHPSKSPTESPPTTPATSPATTRTRSPTRTPAPRPAARNRERVLPPARPTYLAIPAIEVRTPITRLGKNPDGTIQVPQPGPDLNKAAWYENSPTPGQLGPSVIEGHVDTEQGRSVFWRLAELRPGDRIRVTRADGKVAVFTVDSLRTYPKVRFPTRAVYGGDLSRPQLRLITCSNFDSGIGHYTGNLVVSSHLTTVR